MNNRFPLYPEDRSNQFGRANELDKSGGIFDSYRDENRQQKLAGKMADEGITKPAATRREKENSPDTADKTSAGSVNLPSSVPQTERKQSGKKGIKSGLFAVGGVLLAAVILGVVYYNTHAILGELFGRHEIYTMDTTEIDLSGSDYNDYSALSRLKSLEVVDLTNSPFNKLSDLYGCENLKTVVLADRVLTPDNCIAFYEHIPNAHLVCRVDINGKTYDSGLTELKLNHADPASIKLFAALNKLEIIDFTEADISEETLNAAYEAFPDCNIIAKIVLNGNEYRTDVEDIRLSGVLTERDAQVIAYFRHLNKINVVECKNAELIDPFLTDHPEIKVSKPVVLLGKTVGTEDELVDLRGRKYTLNQVQDALAEALPNMKSLKKIDMCGCGLTNKEMEKLCNAYPDIKFVWMIHFGIWHVRTDAVAFAALNSNGKEFYNQDHYAPLFKYCTELRALDLGHSLITDISAISSLKKLRAVILTDNKIRNIDSFAELHDLEFIEMNATNHVKSIEPLRNLNNLRFVNLWDSNQLKDLSPLYHHDKLEMVIFDRAVPKEEREKFISANPNCQSFFYVDYSLGLTTTKEWRENPYRTRLKQMFRTERAFFNWRYVTGFNEETGEYILDYSTDQYRYM